MTDSTGLPIIEQVFEPTDEQQYHLFRSEFHIPATIAQALEEEEVKSLTPTADLALWCDGGFQAEEMKLGSGSCWSKFPHIEVSGTHSACYSPGSSSFQAECLALTNGIRMITAEAATSGKSIVILSDSQSLLKHLDALKRTKKQVHGFVYDALTALAELWQQEPTQVSFHWIPGHRGIGLNEQADELATKGLLSLDLQSVPTPGSALKHTFKQQAKEEMKNYLEANIRESAVKSNPSREPFLRRYWEVPAHERHVRPSPLERRAQIAIFRLRTGHSQIETHGKRFGIFKEATCQRCEKSDATPEHVLIECTYEHEELKQARSDFIRRLLNANQELRDFLWSTNPEHYKALLELAQALIQANIPI